MNFFRGWFALDVLNLLVFTRIICTFVCVRLFTLSKAIMWYKTLIKHIRFNGKPCGVVIHMLTLGQNPIIIRANRYCISCRLFLALPKLYWVFGSSQPMASLSPLHRTVVQWFHWSASIQSSKPAAWESASGPFQSAHSLSPTNEGYLHAPFFSLSLFLSVTAGNFFFNGCSTVQFSPLGTAMCLNLPLHLEGDLFFFRRRTESSERIHPRRCSGYSGDLKKEGSLWSIRCCWRSAECGKGSWLKVMMGW